MTDLDHFWRRVQGLNPEQREAVYLEVAQAHGEGFAQQVRNEFEFQLQVIATSPWQTHTQ